MTQAKAGASMGQAPSATAATVAWPWWLTVGAVGLAVGLTYSQELGDLVDAWSDNPDYSHGFLVPPVAAAILYRWWPSSWASAVSKPSLWGWALVVFALAARTYWHESGRPWLEQVTLLPLLVGLVLAMGGWRLLRWTLPALGYLIFMFPLPSWLNQAVSVPLQRLATVCTTQLLRLTGLWVIADGNVIHVGAQPLEVARACNGLSMLMSLAATVMALVLLVPMPLWKRLFLIASIVPVALLCNVLRITATAWCYHMFGAEVGERYAHDLAGYLMMPLALVLVGLELLVLSWLFVEEEETEAPMAALLPTPGVAPIPLPTSSPRPLPPLMAPRDKDSP